MEGAPMPAWRRLLCFALLAGPALTSAANDYVWPDVAPPCNGTLQVCISGAGNGDTVTVYSSATIDEELSLLKPLSLVAAPGYRPTLAAGNRILAYYTPASDAGYWSMTIAGFSLLNGSVQVTAYGGNATVAVRGLDLLSLFAVGITVRNVGAGTTNFDIAGNLLHLNGTTGI